jgi:hypothetical protein
MPEVERLQLKHDKLQDEIEKAIDMYCLKEGKTLLRSLVNQYGNTCIRLVEAENKENNG